MAVLTYRQRRRVDSHIRCYRKYKDDIEEWRQSVICGSPNEGGGRKRTRRVSDPTAAIAMRLASPPRDIRDLMAWVSAVDEAQDILAGSEKAELFAEWFWHEPQTVGSAARRIHVSERRLRYWISDIIVYVALIAAEKGAFTLTE